MRVDEDWKPAANRNLRFCSSTGLIPADPAVLDSLVLQRKRGPSLTAHEPVLILNAELNEQSISMGKIAKDTESKAIRTCRRARAQGGSRGQAEGLLSASKLTQFSMFPAAERESSGLSAADASSAGSHVLSQTRCCSYCRTLVCTHTHTHSPGPANTPLKQQHRPKHSNTSAPNVQTGTRAQQMWEQQHHHRG